MLQGSELRSERPEPEQSAQSFGILDASGMPERVYLTKSIKYLLALVALLTLFVSRPPTKVDYRAVCLVCAVDVASLSQYARSHSDLQYVKTSEDCSSSKKIIVAATTTRNDLDVVQDDLVVDVHEFLQLHASVASMRSDSLTSIADGATAPEVASLVRDSYVIELKRPKP